MAKKPKTYMVTYHQSAAASKKMQSMTKEEGADVMRNWMEWAKKCGPQLKELGAPLGSGLKLTSKEGPVPSKRKICGYSILETKSLAEAKKLLKNHPHLNWIKGCEIEVHEFLKDA